MATCKPLKKNKPQHAAKAGVAGFTLIELLIVVAIIGIIAVIAIPSYQKFVGKAKIAVAQETLSTVRNILIDYIGDNNTYPTTIDFTSGMDDRGRIIFQQPLQDQINQDFRPSSLSYAVNPDGFTITAQANDRNHTVLIMTESSIIIQGN